MMEPLPNQWKSVFRPVADSCSNLTFSRGKYAILDGANCWQNRRYFEWKSSRNFAPIRMISMTEKYPVIILERIAVKLPTTTTNRRITVTDSKKAVQTCPEVAVNKEPMLVGASSQNSNDRAVDIIPCAVKCETDPSMFHGNAVPKKEKVSIVRDLVVRIKRENKENSSTTIELSDYHCDDSAHSNQESFPEVKHEMGRQNVENDNRFGVDAPSAPADDKSIISKLVDELPKQFQIQPGLNRRPGRLKLLDISVELVDLFSSELRKLGKAHSNKESCLCMYCQRKSSPTSKNLQSKKEPMISRSFSNKLKNLSKCQGKTDLNQFTIHSQSSSKKQIKRRKFTCNVCSQKCKDKYDMRRHLMTHSNVRPFKCALCPAKFKRKESISRHWRVHSGEKPYKCKLCPRKFRDGSCLKIHSRAAHSSQRPFECEFCSAKFKEKSTLTCHRSSVHVDERPFVCGLCPAKFKRKTSLNNHLKTHTSEKPFKCSECPAAFIQKRGLICHLRNHTEETPFECNQCLKKFRHDSTLYHHLKTHKNETPFECDQCHRKFKTFGSLDYHVKVHNNEKPFKCNQCPAKYVKRFVLNNHLRKHTGETPFECPQCSRKFSFRCSLNYHLKVHNNDRPFKCNLCPGEFVTRFTLKTHMRVHNKERPYECSLCPSKFRHPFSVTQHMRVHKNEKQLKCNQCSAKFMTRKSLSRHLKVHSDVGRPLSCAHCTAKFKRKGILRMHLKSYH